MYLSVCLSVCLSACLSISFIETQTLLYIANTKYKQSTKFSFSVMQTTLIVYIVYVLTFFSVCLSVSLSVCLSFSLSVCLSACMSACMSVSLSLCLSVCLSVCLSLSLFVCPFLCWSVSLCVCVLLCLSVSMGYRPPQLYKPNTLRSAHELAGGQSGVYLFIDLPEGLQPACSTQLRRGYILGAKFKSVAASNPGIF